MRNNKEYFYTFYKLINGKRKQVTKHYEHDHATIKDYRNWCDKYNVAYIITYHDGYNEKIVEYKDRTGYRKGLTIKSK